MFPAAAGPRATGRHWQAGPTALPGPVCQSHWLPVALAVRLWQLRVSDLNHWHRDRRTPPGPRPPTGPGPGWLNLPAASWNLNNLNVKLQSRVRAADSLQKCNSNLNARLSHRLSLAGQAISRRRAPPGREITVQSADRIVPVPVPKSISHPASGVSGLKKNVKSLIVLQMFLCNQCTAFHSK